jgi:hypothetical protein
MSCLPGCSRSYADPSGLTRHRQKGHPEEEQPKPRLRRRRAKKLDSTTAPPPVNPSKPTSGPEPRLEGASVRSTSPKQNHSSGSTPRGHPGGFHAATDVPNDSWSTDQQNQKAHQAYNANQEPAPTAWRSYPNTPELSSPLLNPAGPSTPQPTQCRMTQSDTKLVQGDHKPPCTCLECYSASLTLAPLNDGMQGQPQSARIPKISYPRMGHVPPSDLPPMHNIHPSYEYPRPYLRMLFDNQPWNMPPPSTQSTIRTHDSVSTVRFHPYK